MNHHQANNNDTLRRRSLTQASKNSKNSIISTANDAIKSKLSAANKGYYLDPFVQYLAIDGAGSGAALENQQKYQRSSSLNSDSDTDFSKLGNNSLILKDRMRRRMNGIGMHHRQGGRDHHQPLIRRGTFARTCTIDYAISAFLSLCHEHILEDNDYENEDIQIVVLGSGRDTTYLRAKTGMIHGNDGAIEALEDGIMENVQWYEIDHEKVIREKQELLTLCPLLDFEFETFHHEQTNESRDASTDSYTDNAATHTTTSFAIKPNKIHTSIPRKRNGNKYQPMFQQQEDLKSTEPQQYHLVSFDLCNPFKNLLEILTKKHSFKLDVPTLFVMECVQMYIPEQESRDMLKSITNSIKQPFIALFDPIIQDDAFGKVMTENLTKAKIISNPTMSLLNTRTLQGQIEKLYHSGFSLATGCDFLTCYETVMSADDRMNAKKVEMLDEIEEWILIMRHYCFVVGCVRGDSNGSCMAEKFCSVGASSPLGFKTGKCSSLGQEMKDE